MMSFHPDKKHIVHGCGIAAGLLAAVLASALFVPATVATADTTIGGPYIGHIGKYDYSPTMIQDGGNQDWWWCGQTDTDTILHQSYTADRGMSAIQTALSRGSAGSWDSAFICNPAVIQGTFTNPFGDGVSYKYALYYVATADSAGTHNSIGVAFSKDNDTPCAKTIRYPSERRPLM